MLKKDIEILSDFLDDSKQQKWTKWYDLPDYKIFYRYE